MSRAKKDALYNKSTEVYTSNDNQEITGAKAKEISDKMITEMYPGIDEEIVFYNHPTVTDGTRFDKDTRISTIIKLIAGTPEAPTLVKPTVNLTAKIIGEDTVYSSSKPLNIEFGSTLEIEFTGNYVKNHGGDVKPDSYQFTIPGKEVQNATSPHVFEFTASEEKDFDATVAVDYAEGPMYPDQAGDLKHNLKEGTTDIVSIPMNVKRKMFIKNATEKIVVSDSASVRDTFDSSFLNNLEVGQSLNYAFNFKANQSAFSIAVPEFFELNVAEVTEGVKQDYLPALSTLLADGENGNGHKIINVLDGSNSDTLPYKVYTYADATPHADDVIIHMTFVRKAQ